MGKEEAGERAGDGKKGMKKIPSPNLGNGILCYRMLVLHERVWQTWAVTICYSLVAVSRGTRANNG